MINTKFINILLILISIILIVSCSICTEPKSASDIYSVWVDYKDDYANPRVLTLSNKLDENKYGFIIESDGTFIERKNAGWCGTPPIYYENFDGSWKYISDDVLEITVDFLGGIDTFKIEIVSIDEYELKINYIYDYE